MVVQFAAVSNGFIFRAPSPSGKAEVCKTSIPGSIPGGASNIGPGASPPDPLLAHSPDLAPVQNAWPSLAPFARLAAWPAARFLIPAPSWTLPTHSRLWLS